MLIRAFEIQVRGADQFGTRLEHAGMRHPGVKPDVERVGDLFVMRGIVTEQITRLQVEPGLNALTLDALRHLLDQSHGIRVQFAGLPVDEEGDRHTPGALTRDAPVGAVLDHALDARLAPVRRPVHMPDLGHRGIAQAFLLHRDEPLRRGAENDRGLVSPAHRVAVTELRRLDQGSVLFQHLDHMLVGLEHMLTLEQRRTGDKAAIAADRVVHRQPVTLADNVVIHTVAGCRVHRTGTSLERDVVAQHDGHLAVIERVLQQLAIEYRTLCAPDHLVVGDTPGRHHAFEHAVGHHQALVTNLHQHVFEVRIQRDPLVGRQGPGRGGPDDHRDLAAARTIISRGEIRFERGLLDRLETDVDRKRFLVLVLDLGLGQRRAAVGAPVHRLGPLGDMALLGDAAERADDPGLLDEVHRQVGIVPVTDHAQTLEVGALLVDLGQRIVATGLAKLGGADFLPRFADLFLHLQLDRQAVTVPARHIGGIKAGQGAALDDDVLEHLVNRMPDMDLAIGIRRAVMQHELVTAGAGLADLAVQTLVLPALQHLRFPLRQIGLHRECGVGKIQRVLVIVAHGL